MTTAQFNYCVGLIPDRTRHGKKNLTYNNSLSLLKDFLRANGGEYKGPFFQDGIEYPEYAVVKMTPDLENKLQDACASDLHDPQKTPFVERLEGIFFNVSRVKGMKITPVDAALNKRYLNCLPL